MEEIKIPMLNRFDTISHVMPYYAHTHKTFLLLSSLCKSSRNKLDEFYDEFVECMRENWLELRMAFKRAHLQLPTDLFWIIFACSNKLNLELFIDFIKNLKSYKGCYFNKHFMHLQTKYIKSISVDASLVQELEPYMEILKSIYVRSSKNLSQPISLITIAAINVYFLKRYL